MDKTDFDLVQVYVDPRLQADGGRLGFAIKSLREQNVCLNARIDPATGGAVIRAASEADLDTALDLMERFHIDVEIGPLQVVYRMTITHSVEVDYTHKKHTGTTGEFARVKLITSPNEIGNGFQFKSTTVNSIVPDTYIPGIENGVLSVIQSGSLTDVPVAVDINVVLVDGAFHDIDSSELTFEIASRAALLEALRMTSLALFEPVMKVEVVTPKDHASTIIEDLKSRSGRIRGQVSRGDDVLIDAVVPLSKMLGYADTLDELAPGRATHTIQFDHYLQVSPEHPDPPFRPAAAMRLVSVGP